MPDVLLRVTDFGSQAPPIAITPDIHPMTSPTFAVLRTVEQSRDDFLIRFRRIVFHECIELLASRRQTDQIERHTPQPNAFVCLCLGFDASLVMLRRNESVDRVVVWRLVIPKLKLEIRNGRPHWCLECPMIARVALRLLIGRSFRALSDPRLDDRDFGELERLPFWWHSFGIFGGRDSR